jgi:UDP-N-acetylglucosamine:LPS N-acetylglucosamine transferase
LQNHKFDLIIGDETYEVVIAQLLKVLKLKIPFVMLYDFLGLDAMSGSLFEKISVYMTNVIWSQDYRLYMNPKNLALFVGEPDDVIGKKWGFLLPDRREHAKKYYHFIGHVLPFDPALYSDRSKIKSTLGYGPEPLVVCSIGGTAIGKTLLDLCGLAYPIIKERIPDLHMVLVCGPRLPPQSLDIPEGPEIREFVPNLYRHFAACDLAVVQCGGTSTIELTALRRPFLYFPLEEHCEQELVVVPRLVRHRAGIRMSYSRTTPDSLAQAILSNLGKDVDYANIPINGAAKAAQLIHMKLLDQV